MAPKIRRKTTCKMIKEVLKLMLIWIFLAVGIVLLFGCKTVSSKVITSSKDSSAQSFKDISTADKYSSHEIKTRDTAIVVPFSAITSKATIADLLPNYDAQGKPVAKVISKRKGNLSGTITINPDTSIEFTSQFDSLTMVIKNLTTDILKVKESVSNIIESKQTSKSERITWSELITKVKPFFQTATFWLIIALVVVVFIIIKFIK